VIVRCRTKWHGREDGIGLTPSSASVAGLAKAGETTTNIVAAKVAKSIFFMMVSFVTEDQHH
jgi:hypothetical protein